MLIAVVGAVCVAVAALGRKVKKEREMATWHWDRFVLMEGGILGGRQELCASCWLLGNHPSRKSGRKRTKAPRRERRGWSRGRKRRRKTRWKEIVAHAVKASHDGVCLIAHASCTKHLQRKEEWEAWSCKIDGQISLSLMTWTIWPVDSQIADFECDCFIFVAQSLRRFSVGCEGRRPLATHVCMMQMFKGIRIEQSIRRSRAS